MARKRQPKLVFDFIDGATGREVASGRNTSRFDNIMLQPRVMAHVETRTIGTRFLGRKYGLPFGIAPMGMCDLAWPGADRALAQAACDFDLPVCLSVAGSSTIEEMRNWAGENSWFQLYVNGSIDEALALVERARTAGYDTLILTVDVPQVARRLRDLRNGFVMPFRLGVSNFFDFALHPRWSLTTLWRGTPEPANIGKKFDREASRAGADWDFLDRLRALWSGRLIVKGITSAADAKRVQAAGADAIYVSNHGGRQLDSAPAAIDCLPRIRQALGPDFPLVFDSGLRSGEDIVKALALGANFVMLGRPMLFALGADGARGLNALIQGLGEEISVAMAQIGLNDLHQLSPEVITCHAELISPAVGGPKPVPIPAQLKETGS